MIQLGLLGAKGRMGQVVAQLAESEFRGQLSLNARADKGADLAPLLAADVVIDFSTPGAMAELGRLALARDPGPLPAFVVGSTGWKPEEQRVLETLAARTPVLMSSNFSTGVMALQELLKTATPLLAKLGYTPVIAETHHQHKKDAPSGTAISLQRLIAPAQPQSVQTVSVRGGEIVGDHEVTFYGPGDHLTLGHFAQDRSIFARGAIQAAIWLAGKRPAAPKTLLGMEVFFREVFASK
jgi:4-hydroxy-tetrahydrodipicolinate reductase